MSAQDHLATAEQKHNELGVAGTRERDNATYVRTWDAATDVATEAARVADEAGLVEQAEQWRQTATRDRYNADLLRGLDNGSPMRPADPETSTVYPAPGEDHVPHR